MLALGRFTFPCRAGRRSTRRRSSSLRAPAWLSFASSWGSARRSRSPPQQAPHGNCSRERGFSTGSPLVRNTPPVRWPCGGRVNLGVLLRRVPLRLAVVAGVLVASVRLAAAETCPVASAIGPASDVARVDAGVRLTFIDEELA